MDRWRPAVGPPPGEHLPPRGPEGWGPRGGGGGRHAAGRVPRRGGTPCAPRLLRRGADDYRGGRGNRPELLRTALDGDRAEGEGRERLRGQELDSHGVRTRAPPELRGRQHRGRAVQPRGGNEGREPATRRGPRPGGLAWSRGGHGPEEARGHHGRRRGGGRAPAP